MLCTIWQENVEIKNLQLNYLQNFRPNSAKYYINFEMHFFKRQHYFLYSVKPWRRQEGFAWCVRFHGYTSLWLLRKSFILVIIISYAILSFLYCMRVKFFSVHPPNCLHLQHAESRQRDRNNVYVILSQVPLHTHTRCTLHVHRTTQTVTELCVIKWCSDYSCASL